MDFLYRLAGVLARMSQQMSRFRVNFVPSSVLLYVISGMLCLFSLIALPVSLSEGLAPHEVSVADVARNRTGLSGWVKVRGHFDPQVTLQTQSAPISSRDVPEQHTWALFREAGGDQSFFVMVDVADRARVNPGEVTLTGLLRPTPEELSQKLQEPENKKQFPTAPEVVLAENEAPQNPFVMLALLIISGTIFVLLMITLCTQYVVFRKTDQTPATEPGAARLEDVELRATGQFNLDGKYNKRFLNVPVGLAYLQNGGVGLLSNIDASSRFMGITTSKRAGVWAMLIRPGSLTGVEYGLQYVGFAVLPAFRFNYQDEATGVRNSAIVTCASAQERDLVVRGLTQPPAPQPVPPTPPSSPFGDPLPVAAVVDQSTSNGPTQFS